MFYYYNDIRQISTRDSASASPEKNRHPEAFCFNAGAAFCVDKLPHLVTFVNLKVEPKAYRLVAKLAYFVPYLYLNMTKSLYINCCNLFQTTTNDYKRLRSGYK